MTFNAGSETFWLWPDPQESDDETMDLVVSQFAILEANSGRVFLRTDKLLGDSWKHEEWSDKDHKKLPVTFTVRAVDGCSGSKMLGFNDCLTIDTDDEDICRP